MLQIFKLNPILIYQLSQTRWDLVAVMSLRSPGSTYISTYNCTYLPATSYSVMFLFHKFSEGDVTMLAIQRESFPFLTRILRQCNISGSPSSICNGAPTPRSPVPGQATYFSCTNYGWQCCWSSTLHSNVPDSPAALLVTVQQSQPPPFFFHQPGYNHKKLTSITRDKIHVLRMLSLFLVLYGFTCSTHVNCQGVATSPADFVFCWQLKKRNTKPMKTSISGFGRSTTNSLLIWKGKKVSRPKENLTSTKCYLKEKLFLWHFRNCMLAFQLAAGWLLSKGLVKVCTSSCTFESTAGFFSTKYFGTEMTPPNWRF